MDYLPALQGMIQDVAGHEFLHILTPLNIHSEEIEDFNFVKPTMSEHLWLYEGVTEYFAQLIQLRDGIIDEDAFKNKMREKIVQADKFKPLSFTKMSTKVVKDKYQDHYLNVYQKGALIGFALDLKLTELSKGKYGLRELMLDLSAKYGPNKPFKDEELIDEIINITGYTELRPFFKEYVYGKNRIPYQEYFTTIGWQYLAEENSEGYSFGDFAIGFNPETKEFMFVEVKDNVFSIENQDILYAIEGTQIDHDNLRELIGTHIFGKSNLEPVQLTVIRDGKEVSLNGTPKVSKQTRAHVIKVDENATDTQLKYRSFLFYGK